MKIENQNVVGNEIPLNKKRSLKLNNNYNNNNINNNNNKMVNQRLLVSANTHPHVCDSTMSHVEHDNCIHCDLVCANFGFLETGL